MTFTTPNLLDARTTDGNGTALPLNATGSRLNSMIHTVYVYGTFDGCTVKIQASLDNSTWIDITNASYTTAKVDNITINTNYIRAVVSNDGASTSVSAHIK
jgi:hypothetical protein